MSWSAPFFQKGDLVDIEPVELHLEVGENKDREVTMVVDNIKLGIGHKVVVKQVDAEVEEEAVRITIRSHICILLARNQRQYNEIGNQIAEHEHVIVEALVGIPAKDVNEHVLQEICEKVLDEDAVGNILREYGLVEVTVEDVIEQVVLRHAVEDVIGKTMIGNVPVDVPKALE